MNDSEIVDFEKKFFNKIGQEITFLIDNKEILKGKLKSTKQNFCVITFDVDDKQIQVFYPFLYRQQGNIHTLSYRLRDLLLSQKGKELAQVLLDDTSEENQDFLFNKILEIRC